MSKAYVVKIDPLDPDKGILASAAEAIRKGALVIFPTETVYGIAANMLDGAAVARLYRIKERPKTKPFTVHISDLSMISSLDCKVTEEAKALMDKFWPGPLTLILRPANGPSIGFRMPANKVALELIKAAGVPVVAPSANLSGRPAPTSAKDAIKDLEDKVEMVLDAGSTDVGIESTVLDLTVMPPKVLREGAIKKGEIGSFLNAKL